MRARRSAARCPPGTAAAAAPSRPSRRPEGNGKPPGSGRCGDVDAMAGKHGQHAAVIGIAAGRGVDIAGNGEMQLRHALTGPSNQARATWLSCSVTRELARPSAAGPSCPAMIALTISSKIWRHRNSVVVSLPAKAGICVEIGVVHRLQHGRERFRGAADIDDDIMHVERLAEKGDVDDECRAMQSSAPDRKIRRAGCARS